jgi:hypothetical protein
MMQLQASELDSLSVVKEKMEMYRKQREMIERKT